MTTRREAIAGLAAAGFLAACRPAPAITPAAPAAQAGDRLLVRHTDGLGLFDVGTRKWLAEPRSAIATGLALASLDGGTVSIRDTRTGQVNAAGRLDGAWVPRAARDTQVALVQGKLEPRASTTLLIMRAGKQ